jgi:hypothetical protein
LRVAALMARWPDNARETVDMETPTKLAISSRRGLTDMETPLVQIVMEWRITRLEHAALHNFA